MKKKIKDLTKEQIFNEIYKNDKTSVSDENCKFCKYVNLGLRCNFVCNKEYETCIDYEKIIAMAGNEEIEVDLDEEKD